MDVFEAGEGEVFEDFAAEAAGTTAMISSAVENGRRHISYITLWKVSMCESRVPCKVPETNGTHNTFMDS